MTKQWDSEEFFEKENILGHGKERLARNIRKFLNEKNIQDGCCMVACYLETDRGGNQIVHGLLFYRN